MEQEKDLIDDDALRSVDAFSSDEETDLKDFKQTADSINYGAGAEKLVTEQSVIGNQNNNDLVVRTLADRCKSVGSLLYQSQKVMGLQQIKENPDFPKISRTEVKLAEKSDKPLTGTLYYILYTVLYSACFLCAKYLYDRNPDLNTFQMLLMRSFFALLI